MSGSRVPVEERSSQVVGNSSCVRTSGHRSLPAASTSWTVETQLLGDSSAPEPRGGARLSHSKRLWSRRRLSLKGGKKSNLVLVVVGVEEALTGSDYWEWLSGGTPVAVETVGSGRHNRPSLNRRADTQP